MFLLPLSLKPFSLQSPISRMREIRSFVADEPDGKVLVNANQLSRLSAMSRHCTKSGSSVGGDIANFLSFVFFRIFIPFFHSSSAQSSHRVFATDQILPLPFRLSLSLFIIIIIVYSIYLRWMAKSNACHSSPLKLLTRLWKPGYQPVERTGKRTSLTELTLVKAGSFETCHRRMVWKIAFRNTELKSSDAWIDTFANDFGHRFRGFANKAGLRYCITAEIFARNCAMNFFDEGIEGKKIRRKYYLTKFCGTKMER